MKLQSKNPIVWLIIAATFTSLVLIYLTILVAESDQTTTEIKVVQLDGEIKKLEELLETSILLYANTKEDIWKKNYQKHSFNLKQLIAKNQDLNSNNNENKLTNIYKSKIIEIENSIFERIEHSDLNGAFQQLNSPEYTKYKALNETNIEKLLAPKDLLVRIARLAAKIDYYDSVLTMSAKLFASKGDEKWETRYNKSAIKLDEAIKETLNLINNEQLVAALSKTDAANTKLIEIEGASISLAKNKSFKEAYDILDSKIYNEQKQMYAAGMEDFFI